MTLGWGGVAETRVTCRGIDTRICRNRGLVLFGQVSRAPSKCNELRRPIGCRAHHAFTSILHPTWKMFPALLWVETRSSSTVRRRPHTVHSVGSSGTGLPPEVSNVNAGDGGQGAGGFGVRSSRSRFHETGASWRNLRAEPRLSPRGWQERMIGWTMTKWTWRSKGCCGRFGRRVRAARPAAGSCTRKADRFLTLAKAAEGPKLGMGGEKTQWPDDHERARQGRAIRQSARRRVGACNRASARRSQSSRGVFYQPTVFAGVSRRAASAGGKLGPVLSVSGRVLDEAVKA